MRIVCHPVSIPIGKLSLIGLGTLMVVLTRVSSGFNSHWEVESHWTPSLRPQHCFRHSSFNSHWEVESHWTRWASHSTKSTNGCFNSHWEVESHWTFRTSGTRRGFRQSFNSHWEVESHWTLREEGRCPSPHHVSIPIGKLSLIGRTEILDVRAAHREFQFPLGS